MIHSLLSYSPVLSTVIRLIRVNYRYIIIFETYPTVLSMYVRTYIIIIRKKQRYAILWFDHLISDVDVDIIIMKVPIIYMVSICRYRQCIGRYLLPRFSPADNVSCAICCGFINPSKSTKRLILDRKNATHSSFYNQRISLGIYLIK